tara:strand:- start:59 stop:289 length:231 start_codon:yes stop_codon:yes gene_type:complete
MIYTNEKQLTNYHNIGSNSVIFSMCTAIFLSDVITSLVTYDTPGVLAIAGTVIFGLIFFSYERERIKLFKDITSKN